MQDFRGIALVCAGVYRMYSLRIIYITLRQLRIHLSALVKKENRL